MSNKELYDAAIEAIKKFLVNPFLLTVYRGRNY